MSTSSISNNSPCVHNHHLFSHSLCKNQSLLKRVANVAFHILTLGVPLAVYHIFSCHNPKRSFGSENGNLQATATHSVKQACQSSEALKAAEKSMQEEIANEIANEYRDILKLISSPLAESLLDSKFSSLALRINSIWAKHRLKAIEELGMDICKGKMNEVLDVFVKEFPILQRVRDLPA